MCFIKTELQSYKVYLMLFMCYVARFTDYHIKLANRLTHYT